MHAEYFAVIFFSLQNLHYYNVISLKTYFSPKAPFVSSKIFSRKYFLNFSMFGMSRKTWSTVKQKLFLYQRKMTYGLKLLNSISQQ